MALVKSKKLLEEPRPLKIELEFNGDVQAFVWTTPHMSGEEKKAMMDLITGRNELAEEGKRLAQQLEEAIEEEDAEEVKKLEQEIKVIREKLAESEITPAVKKLICGWPEGGVTDEENDNKPVEYSEKERDYLIENVDGLPMAIFRAWVDQIYNGGARKGNSKASRRNGSKA
jgi:hypothetical protein